MYKEGGGIIFERFSIGNIFIFELTIEKNFNYQLFCQFWGRISIFVIIFRRINANGHDETREQSFSFVDGKWVNIAVYPHLFSSLFILHHTYQYIHIYCVLSIKNCLLYSIQLRSRSVVNMSATCVYKMFIQKFPMQISRKQCIFGKILNTKVSQFRGGSGGGEYNYSLFIFYLLNAFSRLFEGKFSFSKQKFIFGSKYLFYEKKKHFLSGFILKRLFNKIRIFFNFAIFEDKNEKLSDTNETLIFK